MKVERTLSCWLKIKKMETAKEDESRLTNTKNKIIKSDSNFPKTSMLNVALINSKRKNALCLADGTIYITSELYKSLDNEILTFTIAREMGHYKHHLITVKKYMTINSVAILIMLLSSNDTGLSQFASYIMQFEKLNYARNIEQRADLYAKEIMLKIYNNSDGGVRTLNLLRDKDYPDGFAIFSDHPTIDDRIRILKSR